MELDTDSLYVTFADGNDAHCRRIRPADQPPGPPVLMLHGAIESGRIFYSRSNKGLAPFLARAGFDVFVADLRGRGASRPHVSRQARYGQTEAILEEVPAFSNLIAAKRGAHVGQHWIAHSWGGVLMSASLARHAELRQRVSSLTYFGTKRSVRTWNIQRLLFIELVWKGVATLLRWGYGYLPAKRFRLGPDDETAKSHRQSVDWVRRSAWVDTDDGFDYAAALATIALPPAWYLAGAADHALGHPADVQRFIAECGPHPQHYTLMGRANGHARDYGHIDMLTAPCAEQDHFPAVVDWLNGNDAGNAAVAETSSTA